MRNIAPVILAAGDSSRMGHPKALLPLGADTFLTRILKTLGCLQLPTPCVVLGRHQSLIRPLLISHQVRIVTNPYPERGQISSLKLALESLEPGCEGCMVWPVDQPQVSTELVRDLVELFVGSAVAIAMPRYEGRAGHPAIFGLELIEELLNAPLDTNPKLIIARRRSQAAWLTTKECGTIEDIDTPEDYLRLTGETLAAALARAKGRMTSDE
jgi:molybdenum cofactor cytidylyltransferase